MAKIVSCVPAGKHQTYDLEVDHPDHQFYLANGVLTSNSHAMAYAITSYQCAWLQTYYPDEWVAAYLDYCSTDKGKSASGEDPKDVAILEAKSLGYKMGKADINLSQEEWDVGANKTIIPSFGGIKGAGKVAYGEIRRFRPYRQLRDLIVNPDGTWRHSKFNKRALGNMIKIGAFESMDLVGPGKTFANYKQMHTVLIDNYDAMKRVAARKKNNDAVAAMNELVEKITKEQPEDWTPDEKTLFLKEITGAEEVKDALTPEMRSYIERTNTLPLDEFTGPGQVYWAVVDGCQVKESNFGGEYLNLMLHGQSKARLWVSMWDYDPANYNGSPFDKGDVILIQVQKNDRGYMSTKPKNIRKLAEKLPAPKSEVSAPTLSPYNPEEEEGLF